MIRFNNDYSCGAHPRILNALAQTNTQSYGGYGLDEWCDKAQVEIKKYVGESADIHFLVGGTQTNVTVICACLRPFESVISAKSGHINVHETGAVEHAGYKITALEHTNGKICASQIDALMQEYEQSDIKEHIVTPKMVYISQSTEYGTVYTLAELEQIHNVCKRYGLYLFVDGARLGYACAVSDVTLADLSRLCDVFYIGGTKCGALFGEAVVITNDSLKPYFRSYIKQNGAMLAKGWLIGLQFYTLFCDGLYFEITKSAVDKAKALKQAFAVAGIPSYIDSDTNQQFVVLENWLMDALSKKYLFEFETKIDDLHSCVRFCTAWYTEQSDINELINDIFTLIENRK